MSRIRLQIHVVSRQDLGSQPSSSAQTRQESILPWTEPCPEDLTIQALSEQIVVKFASIHVGKGALNIRRIEDGWGGTLFMSDTVGDIFRDRSTGADIRDWTVNVFRLPPNPNELRNPQRFTSLLPESSARPRKRTFVPFSTNTRGALPKLVRNEDRGVEQLWANAGGSNKRQRTHGPEQYEDLDSDRPLPSREVQDERRVHNERPSHSSRIPGAQMSALQVHDSQNSPSKKRPFLYLSQSPSLTKDLGINPYCTPTSLSLVSPQNLPQTNQNDGVIPDSPPTRRIVDLDRETTKSESPELGISVHDFPSDMVDPEREARVPKPELPVEALHMASHWPSGECGSRNMKQQSPEPKQRSPGKNPAKLSQASLENPCIHIPQHHDGQRRCPEDVFDPIESDDESFRERQRMHTAKRAKVVDQVLPREPEPIPFPKDIRHTNSDSLEHQQQSYGNVRIQPQVGQPNTLENQIRSSNAMKAWPSIQEQPPSQASTTWSSQPENASKASSKSNRAQMNETPPGQANGAESLRPQQSISEPPNTSIVQNLAAQGAKRNRKDTEEQVMNQKSRTKKAEEQKLAEEQQEQETSAKKAEEQRLAEELREKDKLVRQHAEEMRIAAKQEAEGKTREMLQSKATKANEEKEMASRLVEENARNPKLNDNLPPTKNAKTTKRKEKQAANGDSNMNHLSDDKEVKEKALAVEADRAMQAADGARRLEADRAEKKKAGRQALAAEKKEKEAKEAKAAKEKEDKLREREDKRKAREERRARETAQELAEANAKEAAKRANEERGKAKKLKEAAKRADEERERAKTPKPEKKRRSPEIRAVGSSSKARSPSPVDSQDRRRKSMTPALPTLSVARPSSSRGEMLSSSPLGSKSELMDAPLRSALRQTPSSSSRRSVSFVDDTTLPAPRIGSFSIAPAVIPRATLAWPMKSLQQINDELATNFASTPAPATNAASKKTPEIKMAKKPPAKKEKIQMKLNVTTDKKMKNRAVDSPPPAPKQELVISSDDEESVSSFYSDEECGSVRNAKAGPSSKKKPTAPSTSSRSSSSSIAQPVATLIDPALQNGNAHTSRKPTPLSNILAPTMSKGELREPIDADYSKIPTLHSLSSGSRSGSDSESDVSVKDAQSTVSRKQRNSMKALSAPKQSLQGPSRNATAHGANVNAATNGSMSTESSNASLARSQSSGSTSSSARSLCAADQQLKQEIRHSSSPAQMRNSSASVAKHSSCNTDSSAALGIIADGGTKNSLRSPGFTYPSLSELRKAAAHTPVAARLAKSKAQKSPFNDEESLSLSSGDSSSSESDDSDNDNVRAAASSYGSQGSSKPKSKSGSYHGMSAFLKASQKLVGFGASQR